MIFKRYLSSIDVHFLGKGLEGFDTWYCGQEFRYFAVINAENEKCILELEFKILQEELFYNEV